MKGDDGTIQGRDIADGIRGDDDKAQSSSQDKTLPKFLEGTMAYFS